MAKKPRPQRQRRDKPAVRSSSAHRGGRTLPQSVLKAPPRRSLPKLPPHVAPFSAGGPNGAWWPTLLWLVLYASAWPLMDEGFVWGAMVVLWFIGMMASMGHGKAWTWPFWALWIVGTLVGMVGQMPAVYAGLACGLIALYWNLRRLGGRNGGLTIPARLSQALVAALALCVGIGGQALDRADLVSLHALGSGARPVGAAMTTVVSASALAAGTARRGDLLAVQGRGHCQASQEANHRVYFDCTNIGWRPDSVPPYLWDRPQEARSEIDPLVSRGETNEAMRLATLLTRRPSDTVVVRVPVGGERKRPWSFSIVDPASTALYPGDFDGTQALQRARDQLADAVPFEVQGRLLDRWKTVNGTEYFVIDARQAALYINPLVWTAGVLVLAFALLGWHGSDLVARAQMARLRKRRYRKAPST